MSLVGCERQGGGEADNSDQAMRIVTLAPSLTQMVMALGYEDTLVGVADYDNAASSGLPVVGNYLDLSTESLLTANPTHVLAVSGRENTTGKLAELAKQGHFTVIDYPYPETVEQIFDLLINDEADPDNALPTLGQVLGCEQEARNLKQIRLQQLERIQQLTATQPKPKTLIVIGLNPVMASGPNTVNDQLLSYAGGVNVAAEANAMAPTYSTESLIVLQPQVILLLRPSDPPLQGESDPRLRSFEGLPVPAVRDERIYLLNDELVLLPGTQVVQVVADIAKALHPDLADQIDSIMHAPDKDAPNVDDDDTNH